MNARIRKGLAAALLAGAVALLVVVLGSQSDGYTVTADMANVAGLRSGANVRLDGAPVGRVQQITLDRSGLVHVQLNVDSQAVPLGRDARVVLQGDDLFGERYLELTRGNTSNPLKSGGHIPLQHTGTAVRLDDVVDSLDLSTRMALETFLREQGSSVVGRGKDLAATLTALPSSLQDTTLMLGQFGQDTKAIGRLIEESDRIVASVDRERPQLGRLIGAADHTLSTLASRRRQLGETIRTAPRTLASAQATLAELRAAARPLAPAADGLRNTAPLLTRTLQQIPLFSRQALPTLRTAALASPALSRLGRQGAPIARRVLSLATELRSYSRSFGPALRVLYRAAPGQFGLMEGWARATQAIDGASHLFRFGETAGTDLETAALSRVPTLPTLPGLPKSAASSLPRARSVPGAARPAAPAAGVPVRVRVPAPRIDPAPAVQKATGTVEGVLTQLMGGR